MIDILALEDYVKTNLSVSRLTAANIEIGESEEYIKEQCGCIKRQIFDSLVRYSQSRNFGTYVNSTSGLLSGICTCLFEYFLRIVGCHKVPQRTIILRFYLNACDEVSQIMMLVRRFAKNDFDESIPMPFCEYLSVRRELKRDTRSLERVRPLLDRFNAPLIPLIQKIIFEDLSPGTPMSYAKAAYFRKLLDWLLTLDEHPVPDINYLLHFRLITLNFNHHYYIEYCNAKLEEKFGEFSDAKKLDEYLWYAMNLKRILPEEGVALRPELPSARDSLKIYVSEEITYLQGDVGSSQNSREKIPTSLTVAELGLLFLTFIKAGIITEGNVVKTLRLVTTCFSTKGAEEPSEESIRSKAYNKTPETSVSLIKKLLLCVDLVRTE